MYIYLFIHSFERFTPEGYFEYTVYPLEGVWDLSDEGRKSETLNKDEFVYRIMIRQPDFAIADVIERAFEHVRKKKPHPYLDDVSFDTIEDGLSLQMLHVGSYDDEPQSFQVMHEYAENHQLERTSFVHREIYLSDFRKVATEQLKTVLRFKVESKE